MNSETKSNKTLRRTMILCCNIARNICFHRVGRRPENQFLLSEGHSEASFWRQANSNFIDFAVLDWCKIFADERNGRHSWQKIVKDKEKFGESLHSFTGTSKDIFKVYICNTKTYRDRFVAHLDHDNEMNIPDLEIALKSVIFYQQYIYEHEANAGDLTGFPTPSEFLEGLKQCDDEAGRVYLMGRSG